MNLESLIPYSPIILAVIVFLIQQRIVVTPEQLERKHREILCDIELRYAKLHSLSDLKTQVSEMNDKIDKIYDLVYRLGG